MLVLSLLRRRAEEDSTELRPWMSEAEFGQLLAVVHALAPRRVLEWGAGGSTATLLREVDEIEHYLSVEHDADWAQRVREQVGDPRLELHWQAPDEAPAPWPKAERAFKEAEKAWHMACEARPEIMRSYIELPRRLERSPYDLVLVDGRARVFCIEEGFALLRPGGVLVVHDAQREVYRPTLERLGRRPASLRWLEGWTQGQICLLRKPIPSAAGG